MAKKKEKIVYYDDGRTIADMSAFGTKPKKAESMSGSRFKDIWNTYWAATRMMFLPTLAIAGGLAALFLLTWVVFTLAG